MLRHIVVMKPAYDLCWVCQQHSAAVLKAANMPEGAKSDVLRKYEEHLRVVGIERSFYKTDNVKMVHHVRDILLLTIRLTWHSRIITLMTPCNLGPFSF